MNQPHSLLAREHFAGTRQSLECAETLPPWCYTSPEFFAIETERLFSRVWNFLGHADRIAAPGDYFTTTVAGTSLLVVRGLDQTIRAFQNTCRHRGTLIAQGEGNAEIFACPYHSWTYDLAGRLRHAPHMDETTFDKSSNGLKPVRLESWAGFMFVNLDAAAPDLQTWLGDLPAVLAPYRFDDMFCARRRDYEVACNWKIYVENSKDAEHVGTVHRDSINRVSPSARIARTVLAANGQYVNTFMQNAGSASLLAGDRGFPPIPTLTGALAQGTHAPLIYPGTYLGCTIDSAWYLNIVPLAANRIRLETAGLFPRAVKTRPDFAEIAANYYRRWDTTAMEDNRICERQQAGLESRLATAGRLSTREALVHQIDNWILDRLFEEPADNTMPLP